MASTEVVELRKAFSAGDQPKAMEWYRKYCDSMTNAGNGSQIKSFADLTAGLK